MGADDGTISEDALKAATAAKSTGKFTEGGKTFHIIGGPKPFNDFDAPFKVTIDSEYYPEEES